MILAEPLNWSGPRILDRRLRWCGCRSVL